MSQNLEELFAAICRSPDDDAPRVAYADFIGPYDADQEKFIRLQLARFADERARRAPRGESSVERDLFRKHGEAWARYMRMFLVPESGTAPLGCVFERGFMSLARIAIENVVGLGPKLFQLAPLQHLDITRGQADGDPARVLAVAGLGQLDSISFAGLQLGDKGAAALAECEALRRATWLDLSSNKIKKEGVIALARSPIMANKVFLYLDDNPCNPGEQPSQDWDGTIAGLDGNASMIEDVVGHHVPWLHYPYKARSEEPDRFHARWFAPASP
jgi:uncharacterized protein (TIGR02996 family)